MHRLLFIWLKEQWLALGILAILLVLMNLCMYIGWYLLGGTDGILVNLLHDGIEMLQVFGGQGVHVDNLNASYLAVGWRHPIVVAVLAGYAASRGSKAVATEIQEQRSEFLFSLPYPRFLIVLAHFFTTMLGTAALVATLVFSSIFFSGLFGPEIETGYYLATGFATFSLYIAVAAIAYFFSSLLRQGGWALNFTMVVILVLYGADFAANLGLMESSSHTLFVNYKVAESLGGLSSLGAETFGFLGLAVLFLAASLAVTTVRNL